METINKVLWATAISLILINSFYFSIKLKFPQFKLIKALKSIKIKNKEDISPKDTLIMALSSKIGVGSLSGTALCIYYGGIGTVFWMLLSTFVLSIINYIENALAIIYKEKNVSGPQYYIQKGLDNKFLSIVYSITVLILYIFFFFFIQSNTITTLTSNQYNINKVFISLIIAITTFVIIIKGIKGISKVCNKLFFIIIIIFIIFGIVVIVRNIKEIPSILYLIIKNAFNNRSIKGGIFNTIIISFQKTIFANEAGVGTSAIISGSTSNKDYHIQALMGLIQTYFINFIVLLITSIVIITSKTYNLNIINGIELTNVSFYYHFGTLGEKLLLIILTLFAFSTIITIYYYGESSIKFLTKSKRALDLLKYITLFIIFTGGIIKATIIWPLIDVFLAILTIINMYSIYRLKDLIILKLSKK